MDEARLNKANELRARISALSSNISTVGGVYDSVALTQIKGSMSGSFTLSKEEAEVVVDALIKLWTTEKDKLLEEFVKL